jgi:hypothetical protein
MDSNTSSDTLTALAAELDEIERRRGPDDDRRQDGNAGSDDEDNATRIRRRMDGLNLTALCFSGGGIRSAAFCLGVLQALSVGKLLGKFDYLSTVSGGGYIGGWLQMRIRDRKGVAEAEEDIVAPNAAALRGLRCFSNYLTPHTGGFSTDTWTDIVLYLRNLLLNWTVFTPLFLLLALLAVFYRTVIFAFYRSPAANVILVAIAVVALAIAVFSTCRYLPSHAVGRAFANPKKIVGWIVVPVAIWSLVLPIAIEHAFSSGSIKVTPAISPWLYGSPDLSNWLIANLWAFGALHFAVMMIGYGSAWALAPRGDIGYRLYWRNLGPWVAASFVIASLTFVAIYLLRPKGFLFLSAMERLATDDGHHHALDYETILATFGPFLFSGLHLLQTALYVGWRREAEHGDLDREWLARLSARILLMATGWTLFAACCVILSPLLLVTIGKDQLDFLNAGRASKVAAGTTLFGALIAWLGKKAAYEIGVLATKAAVSLKVVLTAGATAFAILLFALAGSFLNYVLGQLQTKLTWVPVGRMWYPLVLQAGLAAVLIVLLMVGNRVNVNRFSMHAVYRNRLTRAFLGSARINRSPEPFTGFDPQDSPHLRHFGGPEMPSNALFPVINIALNVTSGDNTAMAERKAESYTATPLHCGSAALHHPSEAPDEIRLGAFVATKDYAGMETLADTGNRSGGPKLGTMLTVSGAAVSPNDGYLSSPVTAFLMTLFNVRLGLWLPNPAQATAEELRLAKPAHSLWAIVSELLGLSTDTRQSVYLSDGGHFENLGLYEMLRRRCRWIVAIDAGQDEACTFYDLGNALRKASIDLGVTVKIDTRRIGARGAKAAPGERPPLGFAIGTIDYGAGWEGKLLYIKPGFLTGLPADVNAYGLANTVFPHESTENQWFTESQFESYRALGMWQTQKIMHGLLDDEIGELFSTAEAALRDNR